MYSQYVLFFSYYSQWEGGWRCVETLVMGVNMTRDDSSYCGYWNVRYLWCIETLVSSYVTSPIGGGGEISLMYSPARGRRVVGVCSVFCIISDIPILGFQTFISTFGTTSNWNRKMFSTSIYRHIVTVRESPSSSTGRESRRPSAATALSSDWEIIPNRT